MFQPRLLPAAALVFVAALVRLLPYILHRLDLGNVYDPDSMPWNVSAIGAISLFGGAYLADRRWAFAVPLCAMFVSDLGIGLLMRNMLFGFHPLIPFTYGSFLLMAWLGTFLRGREQRLPARFASLAGAGLLGELLFFAITNFANWQFQEQIAPGQPPLFPHTLAGLIANYVAAVPFLWKSLTGMAVYGGVLFAACELWPRRAEAAQPAAGVQPLSSQA